MTDKFITDADELALSSHQATELIKSCRGDDDPLRIGFADKLVGKKLDGQIVATQLYIFLYTAGNESLKKKAETREKEMCFKIKATGSTVSLRVKTEVVALPSQLAEKRDMGRVHMIKDDAETDVEADIIEVNVVSWQMLPSANEGGTHSKRQKTTQGKDNAQ